MPSKDNCAERTTAERLNEYCRCITLDGTSIARSLREQLADQAEEFLSSDVWRHLFSSTAVFVPNADLDQMQSMVRALESAVALPKYREQVLSRAPETARLDPGPAGAFMGYDFHLGKDGPRLIEINTNAGGAFLNAVLARAQRQCCGGTAGEPWTEGFDRAVLDQFESEWQAQRGTGRPERIGIVDEQPEKQYLYPEFLLCQRLLLRAGIDAVILSPEELHYESGGLFADGQKIDMVYNRLVDFGLQAPEHAALQSAWLEKSAVITPNPHTHALFADKRNLVALSDPTTLLNWGLSAEQAELLRRGIPRTVEVNADNQDDLWQQRRQWFFKPVAGHGSKGVYRGSKLTKKVFAQIVEGGYIAQAQVPPSERLVMVDGEREMLKVDVRLYTYRGETFLAAARLYRGQTTNFRTPGGGFAPILLKQD